jgi:hypothetical protein
MIDLTDRPGRDALAPVVTGLLSPSLRRDLADLNAQYLELGLTAELEGDPRFAWADEVRDCLRAAEVATLARVAAAPFALFDLLVSRGPEATVDRVEDSRPSVRTHSLLIRCESFAHQAVFLARRVAEADTPASRVVLALSVEARARLMDARPSHLAELARDPRTIRPRWRLHSNFWQTLVGASRRDSPAAVEWAHCIGLCLIGADERAPLPRRRARR